MVRTLTTDEARHSLRRRLLSRAIMTSTNCLLWTGPVDRGGYGRIKFQARTQFAHRLAFDVLVGGLRSDLTIDHLCRRPTCLNPHHMEQVPAAENVRRAVPARLQKTQCPVGHEYTADNVQINNRGGRECKACSRARVARFRLRRRAAT